MCTLYHIYRVRHYVCPKVLTSVVEAVSQAGGLILQIVCCQARTKLEGELLKNINRTWMTDLMPQGVFFMHFVLISVPYE